MGKIIEFVTSCKDCIYHTRLGACTNEKYIKNCRIVIEKGRCPFKKPKLGEKC